MAKSVAKPKAAGTARAKPETARPRAKPKPKAAPVSTAEAARAVLATAELSAAVADLAAARRRTKAAFAQFKTVAPEIPAPVFWTLVEEYRRLLAEQLRAGHRKYPAAGAAEKLVYGAVIGPAKLAERRSESLALVAGFVREYAALSERLHAALDKVSFPLDRSDDTFADLTDGLPLAGAEVCGRVLANGFRALAAFEVAVREALAGHGPALGRLVLEDECSHGHYLDRALRHYTEVSFYPAGHSRGGDS